MASDLLGSRLVSLFDGEQTVGRIVETEAYVGEQDPASHAARRIGRTRRNEPMFGPPGTAYVYRIYGLHWCFNVVTAEVGVPEAVLVRALEPLDGLDVMARRRGRPRDLASGPGRLTQAMGIDGSLNGHPLAQSPLRLEIAPARTPPICVGVSGRIGIREARDWPLRFFEARNPHLSKGPHEMLGPASVQQPSKEPHRP